MMQQFQYRNDDNWHMDDHLELPDECGFEQEETEKVDLFTMKNFELPNFNRQEIKQLVVSENQFIIITRSNQVYRWRPEKNEEQCVLLDLPEQQQGMAARLIQRQKERREILLDRVFLNGHHVIICSDTGDNFYIHYNDNKIRILESLRTKQIKSIAWNQQTEETDTGDILIATKDSKIWSYRILYQNDVKESECRNMVSLPNERQINQIEQFTFQVQDSTFACVIASTNQGIFFFYGVNSFDIMFNKYRDPASVIRAEQSSFRSHTSLLSLCHSKVGNKAHSFVYCNGKQFNLFNLPEKDLNDQILTSYVSLQDSFKQFDMPIQIGLSEFHYYILTQDALHIVSRITLLTVQKYDIKHLGRIQGMQYDKANDWFWIYSERQLCKIDISNEDKDAWKLLMDKKMFLEAYDVASKYNSSHKLYIAGLCGDLLFQQKDYQRAAEYYQRSSKTFEEIFLKFLSCDDMKARQGLEYYLQELMNSLKKEQERTLVLAWRFELLVYRLNETEKLFQETKLIESEVKRKQQYSIRQDMLNKVKESLDQFQSQYKNELSKELVYQITINHGRVENCVEFAKLINDYETIIQHHINQENYKDAINNLKSVKDSSSMEVIQKYSHILMKFEPEQTLKLLITNVKKFDASKIIGGLMNIPNEQRKFGIQFIEYQINHNKCTEKSINNLLIFFLTHPPQAEKIKQYLLIQEQLLLNGDKIYFDLDFALRLFQQSSLIEPQIIIYGMMGLYTESVTLALDYGLIELAKEYAKKPETNDDLRKKLWMLIAERLLKQNVAIDKVIELTKETDTIKIEDLLPHFNENIKIEHFKDEICNSLKNYNEEIEKLKEEMKKLSANSDQLKNELKMTKNKFLIIDTQQKCEHCLKHLFNDTFYIFPCNHGFHKECIVIKIKQQPQNENKISKIDALDLKLQSIIQKSNPNMKQKQQETNSFFQFQLMNIFGGQKQEQRPQSSLSPEEEKQFKEIKEEFDKLVASECIFCGPSVVDQIQIGFEIDQYERESWTL
ncbi:hypothetical protein pb186bvf_009885 [Paramecium bursaria]